MNLKQHFIQTIIVGCGLLIGSPTISQASSITAMQFCDHAPDLSAPEQSQLLQFAHIIRQELDKTPNATVIISRSGLDLARFQIRYSHAAIAWSESSTQHWTARQLYYSCQDKRPKLFDQGLTGFVMGSANAQESYVSIVILPHNAAATLAPQVQNPTQALHLLANTYSANANPFSTQYQNCNQWVLEMLALAWNTTPSTPQTPTRQHTQTWLKQNHYAPSQINVPNWMFIASLFSPLVHLKDHPENAQQTHQLEVTLPENIEAFIQTQYPDSQRIEFCQNGQHAIIRRNWTPLKNCEQPSQTDDQVIPIKNQIKF